MKKRSHPQEVTSSHYEYPDLPILHLLINTIGCTTSGFSMYDYQAVICQLRSNRISITNLWYRIIFLIYCVDENYHCFSSYL